MNTNASILKAADQCVFCGLCLPHCPSYRLAHRESESPRGRISLIQGLLRGELEADPALGAHLDHCLVCRACERMCPSKVPYGQIIDAARERLLAEGLRNTPASLARLLDALEKPGKLDKAASAIRLYQRSGAQRLARGSGLLKGLGLEGLEAQLPHIPEARELREHYPAAEGAAVRGRIGLFRGCIGGLLEGEVHERAIALLTRLGFEVYVPRAQGCCGSLHQHHGEADKAMALARRNIEAFAGLELNALLGATVGCVAQLLDYPQAFELELAAPVFELCDFLDSQDWPESLRLQAVDRRVAVHLPCSQRNVVRRPHALTGLLSRVPGLELIELPGNDICCGAAGSFMLTQPEMAEALAQPKREAFKACDAELLVSNNIGCAQHIAGEGIEVLHPLQLMHIA